MAPGAIGTVPGLETVRGSPVLRRINCTFSRGPTLSAERPKSISKVPISPGLPMIVGPAVWPSHKPAAPMKQNTTREDAILYFKKNSYRRVP
jgi:hypothetical protein